MFREEKIDRIVTLPVPSMTASSEPAGLQHRCFKGLASGVVLSGGIRVGSLKAQVPSWGEQRRFRNSMVVPFGAIDAILPHFDQAIALRRVSACRWYVHVRDLTGNTHSL